MPIVQLPCVKVRVPLRSFADAHSPLHPPTEVCLFDISLDEGANLSIPVPTGHSAFIMPIFGTVEINGEVFDASEPRLPVFPSQETSGEITLKAKLGNAKAVVFSGLLLRQPVHWQGSLALASPEALAECLAAYQEGNSAQLNQISEK